MNAFVIGCRGNEILDLPGSFFGGTLSEALRFIYDMSQNLSISQSQDCLGDIIFIRILAKNNDTIIFPLMNNSFYLYRAHGC